MATTIRTSSPKKTTKTPTPKTKNMPAKRTPSTAAKRGKTSDHIVTGPSLQDIWADEKAFLSYLRSNLPATYAAGKWGVTSRVDGRLVATADVPLSVDIALEMLRYNSRNRPMRPHHARVLAEKFRIPQIEGEGWDDDVSKISILIEERLDDHGNPTGEIEIAVADGQHRFYAVVLAYGTAAQIQQAAMLIEIHAHNKGAADADRRRTDYAYLRKPVTYLNPETDEYEEAAEIPMNQWIDKLSEPKGIAEYGIDIGITGWDSFDSLTGDDLPEVRENWITISIGVSQRVLQKADQDNAARDGGDELDMSLASGPVLREMHLKPGVAATWTRQHYLRVRPHTEKEVTYIDPETSEEKKAIELRPGSLKGGGRPITPPKYPPHFMSDQFLPRFRAAWEAWNAVEVPTNASGNKELPSHEANELYSTFKDATTGAKQVKIDGRIEIQGSKVPDGIILLTLGLLPYPEPGSGIKVSDYESELRDLALRLRYGLAKDEEGNYVADDVFSYDRRELEEAGYTGWPESLRTWTRKLKSEGQTPHDDTRLDLIVSLWQNRDNAQYLEMPRFPGLDSEGLQPDDLKRIKGIDPNRRQGRPKGTGKKTKKAK